MSPLLQRIRGAAPLRVVGLSLLATFLFGSVGTAAELLLLEHIEDIWQWIPLILIGIALVTLTGMLVSRTRLAAWTYQVTMALFMASGLQGLVLHYRGNVEFEIEMYPSLDGLGLVWEAVRGATPTLAPGTMVLLGLVGLAYSYCHVRVGTFADRKVTVE